MIKEAVRKHPGICGHLERVVPEGGTTLCGHYIPAGTVVGIAAPVINHVEEVWGPDADVFRPERWIEASEGQLKSMEKSLGTVSHLLSGTDRRWTDLSSSVWDRGHVWARTSRSWKWENSFHKFYETSMLDGHRQTTPSGKFGLAGCGDSRKCL